jgi:cytochrome c biogenesis protein CcmG/thiol:disulfide interchange protein DsbE
MLDRPIPSFTRAEFSDSDLRGRVTIVNFFASWCPPCEVEHDHLMTLKTRHGAIIYGINYKDSDTGRQDFLQRLGNPYRAVTADTDGSFAREWGINGVPETLIIDSNGIIRYRHTAPITHDDMVKTIVPMLRRLQGS